MSDADKAPKAPEIIVRGGTGTSKSEALYERRFREAEERRDQAEAEKQLSRNQQTLDKPGGGKVIVPGQVGGAAQYTNQFTEHPEVPKAYVCLIVVNRYGSDTGQRCLADIFQGVNPDNPHDLALNIACPGCQERTHKHQQDNQLQILQSNKRWELQQGVGDPIIRWEEETDSGLTTIEHYPSAGVITESEPFVCPDCNTRYRITNNVLRPD
jgi:uncharacterized protein YbaR (Trm112 family)